MSENIEVSPVVSTAETSILQSDDICAARLDKSPEPYPLKKSAGRLIIRIIAAACTETLILVFILAVIISLVAEISKELTDTETVNTAIDKSSLTLPDGKTAANKILLSLGESIPIKESASVARAISAKSAAESVSAIYFATEPRPIFLSGKGL